MLLLCFLVDMLLSKQKGGNKKKSKKEGGWQKVEQLPVEIKGGSYVSKCENYGVFCFDVCICVSIQIGVVANFGHSFFLGGGAKSWVIGPHLGQ